MNYLIWANIYLAVFYSFYWFFLRKETFFQLNRWYLLSSLVLSFTLPLLDLKQYFLSPSSEQLFSVLGVEAQVNQAIIPSVNVGNDWFTAVSGSSILIFIYIAGCLLSFIRLLYQSLLIKKGLTVSYSGQAYSLFRIIRVDPDLKGYSKIIEHEKVHVKQLHSLDILLIELIKIFNWFNPLVYMLHRSIKLNHEYIADQVAAQSDNERSEYAQLIFNQAFSFQNYSQTNNFFNESFTKKRITMLFKNKSKKVVLSRFFLLVPFLLAITAFQTKTPRLSNLQVASIDNNSFIEAFQTDTGTPFTAVGVPAQPPSALQAEPNSPVRPPSPAPALPASAAVATTTTESNFQAPQVTNQDSLENLLFVVAEEMPVPVDGMAAFLRYIGANYQYPAAAVKEEVKGRMLVGFVVEKDGSLSDIKVLDDLGFGTGEEAVRVVKNGPKWKSGIQNGKPVRVQFTLPIVLNVGEDKQ